MSLSVLKVVFWIFGIRGHIPQNDDFRGGRSGSSFVATLRPADCGSWLPSSWSSHCCRWLLWAAVWLAIKLL